MKTNRSLFSQLFEKTNRLSFIGWVIIFAVSIYFINTNAVRYFDINDKTIYTPKFKPFTPFIIIHVLGGMIALLIGPFQFFPAIRKNYSRLHRIIGKIYLLCVLFSGTASVYLAVFDSILEKGEFTFGTGVLGLALAWFITTGMAFWAIKKKNYIQHQEWMIRSYVVTSGFTAFRLIFKITFMVGNFPYLNELGGVTAWACWSLPLLITEFIIQTKKINSKPI